MTQPNSSALNSTAPKIPNLYFQWIDFLRGISCLGIVLYHVRVDLWIGWNAISSSPTSFSWFDRAAALLSIPIPFLRSSVMLFFLISGFCIHYPYVTGERSLALKPYTIRRFFRIYPPYFIVVILGAFLQLSMTHYLSKMSANSLSFGQVISTIFMVQNYGSDAGQMAINPSLWSLPVEIELYLAYPIFYWLLRRYSIKRTMILVGCVSLGALSFLMLTYWDNPDKHLGYVGNFALYWIIWCAGALLAEWAKRDRLPTWKFWHWGIMAGTFALSMTAFQLKLFIGLQDLVWSSFYFTVFLWGLTQTQVKGLLNSKPGILLSSIGLISYSLYLVHYPFFRLCGLIWINVFGAKPTNLLIPIAFSFLAIAIAYIFYISFEKVSHNLARKLASSTKT